MLDTYFVTGDSAANITKYSGSLIILCFVHVDCCLLYLFREANITYSLWWRGDRNYKFHIFKIFECLLYMTNERTMQNKKRINHFVLLKGL